MVHHDKVLKRTADQMCTWEDVEILATWLGYHPREVRRLRSEKETLRGTAYHILTSFYDRTSASNAKRWEMIRKALSEMNKNSTVIELGIDQLIQETFSDTMSEMDPEEIHKENQRLKNARLCKVCKDTDAFKVVTCLIVVNVSTSPLLPLDWRRTIRSRCGARVIYLKHSGICDNISLYMQLWSNIPLVNTLTHTI